MATIKLTIEYDGTAYAGWQRQPNAISVQAVLEEALFRVTQKNISAIAAGRTDSGVHALGQVVSFQSDKKLESERWAHALNSYLPKDISVLSSSQVQDDFHARYSAKGKIYEYHANIQLSRPAINRNRAWHFRHELDTHAMREALNFLLGTHDFTSFRGSRSQTKNPTCTISDLSLTLAPPSLLIHIQGDRFLKHMIRNIVGTLVEVGQHKREAPAILEILHARNRQAAGQTAPAHGLYLVRVLY